MSRLGRIMKGRPRETAVAEILCPKRTANENESGAFDPLGRNALRNVAEGAANHALVRPAGSHDRSNGAISAIKRHKLIHDAIDRCNREMDSERGAGGREACKLLGLGHGGSAARHAGEQNARRHLRYSLLAAECRCRGCERRHAGSKRVWNAVAIEQP